MNDKPTFDPCADYEIDIVERTLGLLHPDLLFWVELGKPVRRFFNIDAPLPVPGERMLPGELDTHGHALGGASQTLLRIRAREAQHHRAGQHGQNGEHHEHLEEGETGLRAN